MVKRIVCNDDRKDTALGATRIARGRIVRVQVLSLKQTRVSAGRAAGSSASPVSSLCKLFALYENRRY